MPNEKRPATLKTIAEAAGVSITTVTRSLGSGKNISAATIEKVRETAKKLGYIRNLDAVKLRTGQSFIITAILGIPTEEEIGGSGSSALLTGMHQRLATSDYSLRVVPLPIGDFSLEPIIEAAQNLNNGGVILDHTTLQDKRVLYLLEQDIPLVTFGRTELFTEHSYFDIDNEYAAYQGTKALIDAGCKKIALIDGDADYMFIKQRHRGYVKALEEANLPIDDQLISNIDMVAKLAFTIGEQYAKQGVTGFICVNEMVFLGARAGVRKALGGDFSKVQFSIPTGSNIGAYIGSPLYSSDYSRIKAGWHLADLLIKKLDGASIAETQLLERTVLNFHPEQAN